MGHDAFARHGLGSAALMVISALHQPPTRRPASSSVPPRSPARPPTGPRNASPTTASSTAPGRPGPWRHGPWRALVTAILSLLPARTQRLPRAGTRSPSAMPPRGSRPGGMPGPRLSVRRTERRWSGSRNTGAKPWWSSETAALCWSPRDGPTRSRPRGTPRMGASSTRSQVVRPPTGASPLTAKMVQPGAGRDVQALSSSGQESAQSAGAGRLA